MWYPPPMKSGINTKNPKKFYHYHCVHSHDTKECHAMKKKDWNIDLYRASSTIYKEWDTTLTNKKKSSWYITQD
jgi:hypothetical protein